MAKTVEGLDKLTARLRAMPEETKRQVSAAIEKSAEELVAQIKRFVPVDRGDLQESVKWDWAGAGGDAGQGSAGASRVDAKGADKLAATVTEGDGKAFYARWVEHGTAATPAQPHFWPAWRLNRKKIRSRIARALSKAIKASAGK
jgi:HK97 gp10 family phage protein